MAKKLQNEFLKLMPTHDINKLQIEGLDSYKYKKYETTRYTDYYTYVDIFDTIKDSKKREWVVQSCYYGKYDKRVDKWYFNKVFVRFINDQLSWEIYTRRTTQVYYNWGWDFNNDSFSWKRGGFSYTFNQKYGGVAQKIIINKLPKWCKYSRLSARTMQNSSLDVSDYLKLWMENKELFESMIQLKAYFQLYLYSHHGTKLKGIYGKALLKAISKGYEIVTELKGINTYVNNTFTEYLDYLKQCQELGLKNVLQEEICMPKDFGKEHTKLTHILNKKSNEIKIKNSNPDYIKRIAKLVGIDFGNDKFKILILPDVGAFLEEGTEMHHCVFANRYYEKENSLIFSIRDRNTNQRIETCEVDKKYRKINQCYGKFDKFTEYHDEIVDLVRSKIPQIVAAY